jgi:hypothetical protein
MLSLNTEMRFFRDLSTSDTGINYSEGGGLYNESNADVNSSTISSNIASSSHTVYAGGGRVLLEHCSGSARHISIYSGNNLRMTA